MLFVDGFESGRNPCRRVNAVRDMSYRNFAQASALPANIFCHSSRETSPCFSLTPFAERHIRMASGVIPNHSCASVFGFDAPEARKTLRLEIFSEPRNFASKHSSICSGAKSVVARGNGRVRRENAFLARVCHRVGKALVRVFLQKFARQFQRQKRRMSFVQMINRWLDIEFPEQAERRRCRGFLPARCAFPYRRRKDAR